MTKKNAEITCNQARRVPNPTGKGGFGEHPENISDGRWDKNNSFSYWMNFFKSLSVIKFKEYEKTKPENERTMAEMLAYARIFKARNDLKEFQEVANRTEGMPKQAVDLTSGGESLSEILNNLEKNENKPKTKALGCNLSDDN